MPVDIIARLKLNAEEFSRGVKAGWAEAAADAEKQGETAGKRFSGGFGVGLRSLAAAAGGATMGVLIQKSFDYAQSLNELSRQLGISTDGLQEYRFAARQLGVDYGDLSNALQDVTQKLGAARTGNKQAARSFLDLGIDVTSVAGQTKDGTKVFSELIGKLGDIKDPARRAQIETGLFGEQWAKIDPLLAAGTQRVDELRTSAHEMGVVLSEEQIQNADKTAKKLAALKDVLATNISQQVTANADAIYGLTDALAGLTTQAIRFVNDYPKLAAALAGAAAGSRFGLPGAAIGAGAGVIMQDFLGGPDPDKNMDIGFRTAALRTANANVVQLRRNDVSTDLGVLRIRSGRPAEGSGSKALQDAIAEASKQEKLWQQAKKAADSVKTAASAAQQAGNDALRIIQSVGGTSLSGTRARSSGARASRDAATEIVDLAAMREKFLVKQNDKLKQDIDDRIDQELKGLMSIGEIGDEIAGQRAQALADEADAAARAIQDLSYYYEDLFTGGTKNIWKQFEYEGKRALANLAAEQTLNLLSKAGIGQDALKTIGKNAGLGSAAASLTGGSGAGGAIGGAIGGALGKEFLSKALGSFAGPLGAIAGGLLGGVVGGLFQKAKYGTAVIGATASGELGVTGTRGNSSGRVAASQKSANALIGSLDSIAEQFGVSIDAARGTVSIGQYKKNWRVSTTGYAGKLNFKGNTGPTGKGLVDFGQDAAAAAEFAMLDLIKDGVLVGLRKGTQTLLQNASELQDGLSKALKFENVFRDLKAFKDPLAGQIDDLNREFRSLIETFRQAGATVEDTAQLEELYGLRRKQLVEEQTGALTDFLQSLKAGSSSPLSLREQERAARAALAPFQDKIGAGQAIDADAFQKAAQTFLDVERQINGSTGAFFDAFNLVSALTEHAIGTINANAGGTQSTAQAFAELTAKSTQQTATSAQATANILGQQTQLLQQNSQLLQQIRDAMAGNPAYASFLTDPRAFRLA